MGGHRPDGHITVGIRGQGRRAEDREEWRPELRRGCSAEDGLEMPIDISTGHLTVHISKDTSPTGLTFCITNLKEEWQITVSLNLHATY